MQSYIIKRLTEVNRGKCLDHFLRLDEDSVYSRFCSPLNKAAISNYVKKMNFEKDGVFGVFDTELNIIGIGECILDTKNDSAEVSFSVEKEYRGHGLGNKLMERIVRFAKTHHKNHLEMFCLRTNTASIHLAQKNGLQIHNSSGESHAEIDFSEVNPALETMSEVVDDSIATYALQQIETINNWKQGQKLIGETIGNTYEGIFKMITPRIFF